MCPPSYHVTLPGVIFKISIFTAGSVRLLRTGATAGTPYSYMINKVSPDCSLQGSGRAGDRYRYLHTKISNTQTQTVAKIFQDNVKHSATRSINCQIYPQKPTKRGKISNQIL